MAVKRMLNKLGRRKKDGDGSQESTSRPDTPSPQTSIRSTSPRPAPSGAVSALVLHSSAQVQIAPPVDPGPMETPNTSRDAWTNLTAFMDLLNHTPMFAPLAAAIENLSWFIGAHEDVLSAKEEYATLRTQLEALFKDLRGHFSGNTPPAMTTSILNLSEAIKTELIQIYNTQDRDTISRYMQANQDLDKITQCYRRIRAHLDRIMLNATLNMWKTLDKQATVLQEAELRLLNMSISARYNSADAHVVQRRECTPNTREKVLLDLKAWKDNRDGEKICWINGMAGTGKTTIANTLCSSLDKSHELGASFFCSRSLPECRNVKFILPTVAYQLARFSDPFRGALLQALERDPDVHTKVLDVQFRRMILEPLNAAAPGLPTGVVVVIDALDECDDGDGVEQIIEVLLQNAQALPIKFLVSSRPEHHIRDRIGKSSRKTQLILHELDEKMVKADIETYLQAELKFASALVTKDQLAVLAERAGALFIYAATVVRYIKRGNAAARLATLLKMPSPGQGSTNQMKEIDQLYETVLISAFDNEDLEPNEKEDMQLVLHTVVCAQEPLTVDALAGLLGLAPVQVADALKPLWSVLHLSESELTHRVNTLHASFPDYILAPNRTKRFACNAEVHHGKLTQACFMRIGRNNPQFNICSLETSYVFDEDIPDLAERVKQNIPLDLLYACQYWAIHLHQGATSNERSVELHEFLSKRLLLWIEVLNLTKRIDKAAGQMEMAISWLQTAQDLKNTMSLARDARRFVTTFATSPVSRSTPHIYVSMLSTWPTSQLISNHYTQRTSGLVQAKGIETTERQVSLLSLIPARRYIYCVAYSPNGTFFAAGLDNHSILILDAVSCRMTIESIRGHTDIVGAIAISPDATQICSGSQDKTLRIWDPQTGRLLAGPLKGHTGSIMSVDFSPDGQWIASGSYDGTVRIWDARNGQMKGNPLDGHVGEVDSVAFSPDGSIVAAGSKLLIHLWDPLSGKMIGEPLNGHTNRIWTLAFTPDGKYLISGSEDRTIRIWDVDASQMAFGPLQEHLSTVGSVTVSPDGKLLVSAAIDDTIRIWDVKSWTTRSLFRHTGLARAVAFSPDNSRFVSGSADGNIRVWEVPDESDNKGVESQSVGHSDRVRSVSFSPCGTYIVSGSHDMTVRTWDVQGGQSTDNPLRGHKDQVTRVGISADSNHIFSVSTDRMIHVWDRQTGQLEYYIGPIETDGNYNPRYQEIWPAAFSFDHRRVVCGSQSGRIYMWEDTKQIYEIAGHSAAVYSIAFSPDGQSFVSGSADGELIRWDASTGGRLLDPIKAHSGVVLCLALSSDGSRVASGSGDRTSRLWNTQTGSPVGDVLRGHTSDVCSLSFSPHDKYIASGSMDMTIRLWDVATGQAIAVFEGHTDWVFSVAFSPDGTRIVSGSADTTIRVWNIPMPVEAAIVDDHAYRRSNSADNTEDNHTSSWTMDERGWVHDHEGRLLLWVLPDLRSVLMRPQNTILISRQGRVELDFSGAGIGEDDANAKAQSMRSISGPASENR